VIRCDDSLTIVIPVEALVWELFVAIVETAKTNGWVGDVGMSHMHIDDTCFMNDSPNGILLLGVMHNTLRSFDKLKNGAILRTISTFNGMVRS